MNTGNCLSPLIDEIIASLKSLTKNSFIPMMQRHVSLTDFMKGVNDDLKTALSKVITRRILGHAGKFDATMNEEDDENEDEEEEIEEAYRVQVTQGQGNDANDRVTKKRNQATEGQELFIKFINKALQGLKKRKKQLKLSERDHAQIAELKGMDIGACRNKFLPCYFQNLVTDDESMPGWKATIFPGKIFLVLKFFSFVNLRSNPDSHQLLFPTPKSKASYIQVTPTVLAHMWVGYLRSPGAIDRERQRNWIEHAPGEFYY